MAPHVVFRTDASDRMGSGHVMRSLALARVLRDAGVGSRFVCREHAGHLCELIEDRGFEVLRLPPPTKFLSVPASVHAAWLGASWERDASETQEAIGRGGELADWLVVDHYGIDARWEGVLRSAARRVMVVDDLADRDHDCDLLLDQNLVADLETRYDGRVAARCDLLLGPEFALLDPLYGLLHPRIPRREGRVRRLLMFFGGADVENLTERGVRAFLSIERPDIELDVVLPKCHPFAAEIRRLVNGHANIHLHAPLPTLGPLMALADLSVGAGGSTSWERLCLGLPSLVVTLAENQTRIAECLHDRRLVRWIGHHDEVDEVSIARALREVTDEGLDGDWSGRCLETVDGRGARRVVAAMMVDMSTALCSRFAQRADESLLVRCGLYGDKSDAITSVRKDLRDVHGCQVYVLETENGEPVGAVRFVFNAREWDAWFGVRPAFDRPGLSRSMVQTAVLALRSATSGVLTLGLLNGVAGGWRQFAKESLVAHEELNGSTSRWPHGVWRIGVCSDKDTWLNRGLAGLLIDLLAAGHVVNWTHNADKAPASDFCFYLSYGRIVGADTLARHAHNIVVHESALPRGRGWSPLTWQVLEGATSIPVRLFEAAVKVDSGPVYLEDTIMLRGDELVDDLRRLQADATIRLCHQFAAEYPEVLSRARAQSGEATYYQRRRPEDAQLNLDRTLREQTNLLRVSDNDRYPAWIDLNGRIIRLRLE